VHQTLYSETVSRGLSRQQIAILLIKRDRESRCPVSQPDISPYRPVGRPHRIDCWRCATMVKDIWKSLYRETDEDSSRREREEWRRNASPEDLARWDELVEAAKSIPRPRRARPCRSAVRYLSRGRSEACATATSSAPMNVTWMVTVGTPDGSRIKCLGLGAPPRTEALPSCP
jgi:hypothetical protein